MKPFNGEPGEENFYVYSGSHRWVAVIGGLIVLSILILAVASVFQ